MSPQRTGNSGIVTRSKYLVFLVALTALVVLASACGDDGTPTPMSSTPTSAPEVTSTPAPTPEVKETYKIGVMQDLSGPARTDGEVALNSIIIAAEEINEAGGIDGHPVELVVEDEKCNAADALLAYDKLVNVDGVTVILGPYCSGDMLAIADQVDEDQVIVIMNVGHPLGGIGHPFAFRNSIHNLTGAPVVAGKVYDDGHRSIASVSSQTDYAESFREEFAKAFEALGGSVIATERTRVDENDFRPTISKILPQNPDAVLTVSQGEEPCGAFVRQLRELGYAGPLYSDFACVGTAVQEIAGDALTGAIGITLPSVIETNQKAIRFFDKYRERYGFTTIEFVMAASYDSMYLAAQCIEEVGSITDTVAIKQCLDDIENYEGALGNYYFDEEGEIVGIEPLLIEILPVDQRTTNNLGYKFLEQ